MKFLKNNYVNIKLEKSIIKMTTDNIHSGIIEFEDVEARNGHVAVSAANFMLVWGGYTTQAFGERYLSPKFIYVYHADLKYWTKHKTKGDHPPGTSGAAAYIIHRTLYIFAGHTEEGNVANLYSLDLEKFIWTDQTTCDSPHEFPSTLWPSPRDKFASWSYCSSLYVFGGYGVPVDGYLHENGIFQTDTGTSYSNRGWNNQLLVYHTETGWTNPKCTGTAPLPRAAHAAARLNSQVYIFGGRHGEKRMNDLHILDLDTYTWSGEVHVEGASPCGRSWHTFVPVTDTSAFLYGGYSTDRIPLSDAWQLNVCTRQWSQVTVPNDQPRLWHTCCCTSDGDILVFGGCCNDILQWDAPDVFSNEVLTFHLQPLSLQRLCLDAVYNYKDYTIDDWCVLPKLLNDWLQRKQCIAEFKSSKTVKKDQKLGSTCSLS